MQTVKSNEKVNSNIPSGRGKRVAIVTAEWNSEVTESMRLAAIDMLLQHDVNEQDIVNISVPGVFELTAGARHSLKDATIDSVICIGCVIQGETRHFEFLSQAAAQGLTNLSLMQDKPVIFSVLTTNDMQQALDRAGGNYGNKGAEGAIAALKMMTL